MPECAHDKDQTSVCTPKETINKLAKFVGVSGTDKQIMDAVKVKTKCETEACIYKQKDIIEILGHDKAEEILKEFFKPNGPAFSTEWLSNYNIDDVLAQFAKKHKSFLHVYFQMRDFASKKLSESDKKNPDIVRHSLNDMDLAKKIKEGITTFGCALNTDLSSGNGEHWFCLFGDFRKEPYQLEYFNSSGEAPLDEVRVWLDKTKHEIEKKTGKRVNIIVCRTRHQYDSHSCGPYSLFYIVNRLKGVPANTFNKSIGGDKKMVEWRKNLFTRAES